MTRLLNGLIPHYHEGTFTGSVYLDGKDTRELSLFEISQKVGSVFQNPRSQFFNVDTTTELAFGPENHGLPEKAVRERVRRVAEQLKLESLLDRSIFSLSGGEKQKIACGSAAAIEPDIYVLDEPSSNLDAYAIADFRKLLTLLKDQGKTIVISEHRLYYLRDLADRVLYMKDGEIRGDYAAAEFQSLPAEQRDQMGLRPLELNSLRNIAAPCDRGGDSEWKIHQFFFAYKHQLETLHIDEAVFPFGGATAIIGHNGAGKSTLSRCLCGLEKRCGGIVRNQDKIYSRRERLKLCYMVMQDVNHQLFTESVLDEVFLSMGAEDRKKAELVLEEMDLLPYRECHPMGLSGGQKQRVAVASAIASERPLIVFDEPTSGLDPVSRNELMELLRRIAADGQRSVLFSTHITSDLEKCASHITFIKDGTIQHTGTLADFRQHYDYLRQPGQELTLEDIIVSVERRPLDENAIV